MQIFAAKRSSTTEIPVHKIKTTLSRLLHVAKTATLGAGHRCMARVMDCMIFIQNSNDSRCSSAKARHGSVKWSDKREMLSPGCSHRGCLREMNLAVLLETP